MLPMELKLQRQATLNFITADSITLELTPMNKMKTDSGGFKYVEDPARPPQIFRLVPQTDVMPQVQTPDGIQLTPTYVLLGLYDCEMGRWDKFPLEGANYQIVSPIRPERSANRYITKADVARI